MFTKQQIRHIKPYTVTTKDSDFSSKLKNILDEQFNPDAGFVYLTSIMDLFSRKIIPWTLSESLEVSCVIDTINKAKKNRRLVNPVIIHSDSGSQYVSKEYRKAASKMILSYSKKAYPWDNACIESFHAIIKREWINRFRIKNYRHAYILVFEYIETFYNTIRIHSHCNYMSPNEFEKTYEKVKELSVSIAS